MKLLQDLSILLDALLEGRIKAAKEIAKGNPRICFEKNVLRQSRELFVVLEDEGEAVLAASEAEIVFDQPVVSYSGRVVVPPMKALCSGVAFRLKVFGYRGEMLFWTDIQWQFFVAADATIQLDPLTLRLQ